MALNIGYLNSDTTIAGDEVYTPFYAVEPLLEFLTDKTKIIWCPFDEEWSAFYQTFKNNGYNVIRSHINEGKNFFTYEPENWDILISNPPFSKKDEVLERAYELNKPFALLLPANSIQGKKRFAIFKNEIQMLCFDGRINYHTRGNLVTHTEGNHFGSAYFCRNFLPTKLELRELKEYQKSLADNNIDIKIPNRNKKLF